MRKCRFCEAICPHFAITVVDVGIEVVFVVKWLPNPDKKISGMADVQIMNGNQQCQNNFGFFGCHWLWARVGAG